MESGQFSVPLVVSWSNPQGIRSRRLAQAKSASLFSAFHGSLGPFPWWCGSRSSDHGPLSSGASLNKLAFTQFFSVAVHFLLFEFI